MPGLLDLVLQQSPGVSDPEQATVPSREESPQQAPRLPSLYDAVTRPETAATYGNLATARVNAQNETPSVIRAVAQRLPFIRSAFNFGDALLTDAAQSRIAANQGTEADFSRVASGERLQQFKADMTSGEHLGESLMDIPAMLAESLVGGRVLGNRFTPQPGASLGVRASNALGQATGTAAIMGNWLPRWTESNQAQGRRALDVRGLPAAFGHEVATMAVLGSLGHFGDAIGANNIGGFLLRGLARVEGGMLEQSALDVATSALQNSVQSVFDHDLGLDAGYGLVGQLGRSIFKGSGEGRAALANATQQALTFAVFAGTHEAGRTPIMREYSARMRDYRLAGVPAAEASRRMSDATSLMQAASERDMTRQEARTLLQNIPEGPARSYGEVLARTIPEEGRGSRVILNQPMRMSSLSDLTGRAERYGSETFTDQPRRQPSLADLAKPTPPAPPEPKHPVQVLSERVSQLDSARRENDAKIKGLPKKGGPEFERLTAESIRLFKESQATKAELASEMAKGRPREAAPEARQGVENPKTSIETPKTPQTAPDATGKAVASQVQSTAPGPETLRLAHPELLGHITRSFADAFPGARATSRLDMPALVSPIAGGTEVIFNPKSNSVHIDIGVNKQGVAASLGKETLSMMRGLSQFLQGIKSHGTFVEYRAIDYRKASGQTGSRANVYAKLLERAGFEKVSESKGEFVWRPKEQPKSPMEPTVSKPSLHERALAKGREAAATAHPVEQKPPIDPRTLFRDFAERAIATSGDVRSIMRGAPGFPNRQEMYKSFGVEPRQQKVLEARFADNPPSLRALGKTMNVSYQTIKNIESKAIEKIVGERGESAYQAMVVNERKVRTTKAQAVGDSITAAVARGEVNAEKGKPGVQEMIDKVQNEHDDAIAEMAARRKDAIAAGISPEKLKALDNELIAKAGDFNAEREASQRLRNQRKGSAASSAGPSQTETTPPIPGRAEPVPAGNSAGTGVATAGSAGREPINVFMRMPAELLQKQAKQGVKGAINELARRETTPADFGRPVSDAERGILPGGGQPNAGETPPAERQRAAIANAAIDKWRESQGLTPILGDARRADPVVWDRAMARLTADPAAASKLVDEIIDKPRATTAEENALLLHRTVAVRNERQRNMLQLVDAYQQRTREGGKEKMSPELAARMAELERTETDLAMHVDRVDQASRLSGSEWGRAGRWRQMLLKDDFTLAGMLRSAEVAAGHSLTESERIEITDLNAKIADLEKKLQEAESSGKVKPDKPSDEGFAVDQARKTFTRKIAVLKDANAPLATRAFRLVGETFNLPRSIMASIDFPLLRQGHLAMLSHPIRTMQAVPEMLRAAMSEKNAARSEYEMRHREQYPLYKRGGLDLTTREEGAAKREEGFLSRSFGPGVVEGIKKNSPALGTLLETVAIIPRASERAYQTVMNRIRADSFDAMVSSLSRDGKITDAELKVIGNYVNVMTGRGPLGVTGEKAAMLLNQVFFAPRWTASRFQFIAGQPLFKNLGESAPRARRLVLQEYAKVLAGLGVSLGLAAGFGGKIDWNPTSSGFGQLQIGNTFLDLTGGLRRPTTLISRLWAGHKTDAFGIPTPIRGPNVPHGGQTGADLIGNYFRSSLAPAPGAGVNLAAGSDLGGKPSTLGGELGNMATPLFAKDVYQAMNDLGVEKGTIVSLMTLIGLSTQTRTQDVQPRPPVTAASRREAILRGQLDNLRNAIRGRVNTGGRVIQGPTPSVDQRRRIQLQIDQIVRQLP